MAVKEIVDKTTIEPTSFVNNHASSLWNKTSHRVPATFVRRELQLPNGRNVRAAHGNRQEHEKPNHLPPTHDWNINKSRVNQSQLRASLSSSLS